MFMPGSSGIIPGVNSVAVGAPSGTDPHWANVVLLVSGDGANGSTLSILERLEGVKAGQP